ncbi:DUF1616 domain-containing protein [Salinadaptatus halalkaliphilus]|uniref:DUF1616 domain-containing protein n=1 Tax=Salinadaptatus halalkaliphilus TaxID=2419781 RepID=A0A4S3TGD1_9EURY|nr:DUF1616 domain-containing protein [Salinadaptatus halalkaliphilus]THE62994.1 DUF1616 domain-containing protein [Salinadaptatus halalkaliphilus]
MSIRARTWQQLTTVRQYPFDLAVISLAAICVYAVVVSLPAASPFRVGAAALFVLFLPGYALVAVLFPATATAGARRPPDDPGGVDAVERVGLSFVLSLTIVALLALVLALTPWGLGLEPLAVALGGITIVLAQLGAVRRLRLSPSERFVVSPIRSLERLRARRGPAGTVSTILLTVAIGLAVGALLLGVFAPVSAGGFSELGLYTETDDGELVAGELPGEVEPGGEVPVTIAVENHEGERTDYTVVVQQTTIEDDEVLERETLQELEATVADGETETGTRSLEPTAANNETVRIDILLYQGEPPAEPTTDNAEVDTYFWVTVTDEADS